MINGEKKIARPFRWGIVGGGRTSQVGYKHRLGALMDNTNFQLVAAAFDIDPERCVDFGRELNMDPARCYPDYKTLFFEREQGEEIKKLAEEKGKIVAVTYGFSGFPMLKQMRAMIRDGAVGKVNMVELRYTHGFGCDATADVKAEGQKWRVDPRKVGRGFVLGDLSTHTFYMSELICPELKLDEVLCFRQAFVGSRYPLEDNAYVMMKYEGGAVGRMWTSAVNAGDMTSQHIRIVGSKASLEWNDSTADRLIFEEQGKPQQVLTRGMDYLDDLAKEDERLGALHFEGLPESWANLYTRFAIVMDAKDRGDEETVKNTIYPDIDAGIDGIRWINACADSADNGSVWTKF